jgi:hypothetical protein
VEHQQPFGVDVDLVVSDLNLAADLPDGQRVGWFRWRACDYYAVSHKMADSFALKKGFGIDLCELHVQAGGVVLSWQCVVPADLGIEHLDNIWRNGWGGLWRLRIRRGATEPGANKDT